MGFLSKLLKKQDKPHRHDPISTPTTDKRIPDFRAVEKRPYRIPVAEKSKPDLYITGPVTRRVYIYYNCGLEKMKDGQHFSLSLSFEPQQLVSKSTETIWDIDEQGYALMYKGMTVGALDYMDGLLREVHDLGFSIDIEAEKRGWYKKPIIPNIITYWPEHEELKEWLKAVKALRHPLSKSGHYCSFNITAEPNDLVPANTVSGVFVKLIPAPKKSSAKPHIGFFLEETLLFDIDAKSTAYKTLLSIIGKTVTMNADSNQSIFSDGRYLHVVCLVED